MRKQNKGTISRRIFFSSPTTNTNNIYTIYDQILESNPSEIRAYNGKRKLMLQESERVLDVISMYLTGIEINKKDALFKDRLAKEYLRVLTGSSKDIKSLPSPLNNKKKLLATIENYYEEAILLDGNNQQLIVQLEKLRELKGLGFFDMDSRKNKQLKNRKKINKDIVRNENSLMKSSDYLKKVKRLKLRNSDDNRSKELLNSEKNYIRKLQKEKNYALAVGECVRYYKRNPNDVDGLKLTRVTLNKSKRYDLLEAIERENNKNKNTFWSNIALFNILLKRIELSGGKNYSEVSAIVKRAESLAEFNTEKFEVKNKILYLSICKQDPTIKKTLIEYGQELVGFSVPYRLDRFTRLCVDYFMLNREGYKALQAIDVVLTSTQIDEEDELLIVLKEIGRFREITNVGQNDELQKLKEKILNV